MLEQTINSITELFPGIKYQENNDGGYDITVKTNANNLLLSIYPTQAGNNTVGITLLEEGLEDEGGIDLFYTNYNIAKITQLIKLLSND